jgi:hypothetical protein
VVRDRDAGSARVVVRGPITVHVGDVEVDGTGVSTWIERVVGDASTVRVAVDGADASAGEVLPVVEAVVAALAVSSDDVEAVAPDAVRVRPAGVSTAAVAVAVPASPAAPPARVPEVRVPSAPPPPPVQPAAVPSQAPAEQTMVPAEETIASARPAGRPSAPSAPNAASAASNTLATSSAPIDASAGSLDGDHDGMTVASIDIRRLREERSARTAAATPANGTPGASIASAPISIRLPDGSLEPVAHEVVLGRAPSVSKVSGGRIPRLVTIGLGDPDISRSHVRLALEGDTVVVTDLHSRNGTHVAQPGKAPVKLRAGEPTPVLAGTVVDFGGGWTIQVVAD